MVRVLGLEAWVHLNDGGMIEGAGDRTADGDAHFGSVCADDAEIFLCRDGQGSRGTITAGEPCIKKYAIAGATLMFERLKSDAEEKA